MSCYATLYSWFILKSLNKYQQKEYGLKERMTILRKEYCKTEHNKHKAVRYKMQGYRRT